jgi:type IV pilus assembly protein PilM
MADRTSIWKKEIHLRKRSQPTARTAAPATAAEAKPSIWKRELHLGGKKKAVEAVAAELLQPIFDQPSLWDSLPPDSTFAAHEVVSGAPQALDPVEPDPVDGASSTATSSNHIRAEGWHVAPAEDGSSASASYELPTSGASNGENVPAAPDLKHPTEPEWGVEGERAPLELDEAENESDTKGSYGWADAADGPWDVVTSPTSTTGWPGPDKELEGGDALESTSPAPPEPDAGAAVDGTFALPPEAVERPEPEPVTAVWWDSAPDEAESLGAGETESAPASTEPEPVRASAEPTRWSRPASAEWRAAETEPPAADRELEIPVPPPAEEVESAVSVDWTPEKPEPETEAASLVEEPKLEWSTHEQAEPVPPVSGWEHALSAPEAQASAEPENPALDAEPAAQTRVSGPVGPKPSFLKRELRLPRSLRRAQKPSSVKASDAHPIKNIVGLRVGSSQLAAAYVHNNGAAELVQIARTPLARGIVTGGEVRDPEALTAALKKFFSEHKLPRRGIRLGIASNRIGVRMLEVPALDDPRLFENSIRFHAQETLPIPVSDAIIDHVVLGPGAGGGLEPTVRILLVFAHRELVDRHVQACRRAGLKLEGIDFEAFALLRALGAPRPAEIEPTRAVVAVAIGQERTIFAVSDGRICDFTRVLEWGGGLLDVSIARALNLTPSQAEPLKFAFSLDSDAAPSQLTPEQAEKARAAIRTELQSLSRELVSSLQFYQARPGSLDIGEIMLSGGGAQLAGLAAELERLVGVPVVAGDPFARVEVGRKVGHPAEPGSLAVAIGLGIED